jgi:hypothetical protein
MQWIKDSASELRHFVPTPLLNISISSHATAVIFNTARQVKTDPVATLPFPIYGHCLKGKK